MNRSDAENSSKPEKKGFPMIASFYTGDVLTGPTREGIPWLLIPPIISLLAAPGASPKTTVKAID